ncbi:MAG: N-formylglutamate amidohydrolase [Hyphomicrobiales bacterium]|nr:N-formylglutamate amidohydrolase [Hyphomicrobiales bacterium]
MDQASETEHHISGAGFSPFESVPGALDSGALIVCDHASNAIPPEHQDLGLPREALERHIAYDIGAAALARALAVDLGAPAALSTFSRLLIDPNRGADDPTLVMRYSDGAIVPGNARADSAEVARRLARFWAPYRERIAAMVDAMAATGEPPAVISVHSFTPLWRGIIRPWKVGLLWDLDDRIAAPLLKGLLAEADLADGDVGDNEPYDGALKGDTIDAIATSRGLANVLIEVRQDLIAEKDGALAWAARFACLLQPILADRRSRAPRRFGSRAIGSALRRGKLSPSS